MLNPILIPSCVLREYFWPKTTKQTPTGDLTVTWSRYFTCQDISRDWGLIRSTATDVLEEYGIVSTVRKRVPLKGDWLCLVENIQQIVFGQKSRRRMSPSAPRCCWPTSAPTRPTRPRSWTDPSPRCSTPTTWWWTSPRSWKRCTETFTPTVSRDFCKISVV